MRIFDDLDLAGYIEEFLAVKVEALGAGLERSVGSLLRDLVESDHKLAERLAALEETLRGGGTPTPGDAAGTDVAQLSRQLEEARHKEALTRDDADRLRAETVTLRAETVTLRAEAAARKRVDETRQGQEAAAQDESRQQRAEIVRLAAEEKSLRGLLEARSSREKELSDEVQRLQESIIGLRSESLSLRDQQDRGSSRDREERERLTRENQRLTAELQDMTTRVEMLETHRLQLSRSVDEATASTGAVEQKARRNEEMVRRLQAENEELHHKLADALEQQERLRATEAAAGEGLDEARRRADDALHRVEELSREKQDLAEQLHLLSDPETFTNVKLKELHAQVLRLEATMREKDNHLAEAGNDKLLLGQELEKERKEKYENQVAAERRLKELQATLAREQREKEQERQERHVLEEQLAKHARKKWPLW